MDRQPSTSERHGVIDAIERSQKRRARRRVNSNTNLHGDQTGLRRQDARANEPRKQRRPSGPRRGSGLRNLRCARRPVVGAHQGDRAVDHHCLGVGDPRLIIDPDRHASRRPTRQSPLARLQGVVLSAISLTVLPNYMLLRPGCTRPSSRPQSRAWLISSAAGHR
jgi:hypothetical protein